MTKADLAFIQEEDHDFIFMASEELAFEWIEYFLSDVNRIERFFKQKRESLVNEFISMQERFRLKSTQYKDKKKKTKTRMQELKQGLGSPLLGTAGNELADEYDYYNTLIENRNGDDNSVLGKSEISSSGMRKSDMRKSDIGFGRKSELRSIRNTTMEEFAPSRAAKFNTIEDLLDYNERTYGQRTLESYCIPGLMEL